MSLNTLEIILQKRLALIDNVRASLLQILPQLGNRFHRGPVQRAVLGKLGLKPSKKTYPIFNEIMTELGYKQIYIHGERMYRKIV